MTRENIVTAALRLFLTRGYRSVSLVDVAAEVGVTKGGIYHYFDSKDELLHIAFNYLLDCVERKYKELLNGSASLRDVLRVILVDGALEAYVQELLAVNIAGGIDHVRFTIEVMQRFPDLGERIWQSQRSLRAATAEKIRQAVEQGEIRGDTDIEAFAAILAALHNGQGFQPPDIEQRIADSIWNMIRV